MQFVYQLDVYSCEGYKRSELTELKINDDRLLFILDSLLVKEKRCEDYDSSAIWSIAINGLENNEYQIIVTQISNINTLLGLDQNEEKPYGFFNHGNSLYIVEGDFPKDLFDILNSQEFCYAGKMDFFIVAMTKSS